MNVWGLWPGKLAMRTDDINRKKNSLMMMVKQGRRRGRKEVVYGSPEKVDGGGRGVHRRRHGRRWFL